MSEDFGPCCICERKGRGVRNILMLPKRSPYLHGWGCVQCDLSAEGASAIICDACAKEVPDAYEALRFFCKPDGEGSYIRGRARIAELDSQPEWEHDMSKHPEES